MPCSRSHVFDPVEPRRIEDVVQTRLGKPEPQHRRAPEEHAVTRVKRIDPGGSGRLDVVRQHL